MVNTITFWFEDFHYVILLFEQVFCKHSSDSHQVPSHYSQGDVPHEDLFAGDDAQIQFEFNFIPDVFHLPVSVVKVGFYRDLFLANFQTLWVLVNLQSNTLESS